MNNFQSWREDVETWLEQRSGSSKKHRDSLPSLGTLENVQREMVLHARDVLDTASKLYTLIRLERSNSELAKGSK